ncbi:glutathione S-transferase family protein [Chitinolyticbacter meiyuanensis]|uniref:glutathione S-transferase family protein n=1 Tax=Chitinolyticbacter meiyuanensis TaxID=682798 RepID=UPI0011E5A815|nr:glutathione S-transferase family protein [Chitinolyticbacter meiyuanensis]
MRLLIGNKNYSSWSLRPWLVLKHAGIAFEETLVPLYQDDSKARILKDSPSGKVPALSDGDLVVWDSLAIVEYLAEKFPERGIWPADPAARAVARSVCAEMHAGFTQLRTHLSMDIRGRKTAQIDAATQAEIDRILAIWTDCRNRFGDTGPFLFGTFSAADAFYAPVVTRFVTYGVAVPDSARQYMTAVLALPAMQQWLADGAAEPWSLSF